MKKTSVYLFLFSLVFLLSACTKSAGEKPPGFEGNISSGTGSVNKKLTTHIWSVVYKGQAYGTIMFHSDGKCMKSADVGAMEINGTWKLDGDTLTLNFPEEGEPFSGSVSENGENLIVKFMNGAITYTYTPVK